MGVVYPRSSQRSHEVVFHPSEKRYHAQSGCSILEAARNSGIPLESICEGRGKCLKCAAVVSRGGENLSPLTLQEQKAFSHQEIANGFRLACQARILGQVELAIPEMSARGEQVIRKSLAGREYAVNPALTRYEVTLPPPSLHDQESDLSRLMSALEKQHALTSLSCQYSVLTCLPHALRKSGWRVVVTVWNDHEIARVEPADSSRGLFGVAIDVGTTTIAGYLADLATGRILATHALMNPQVTFGEDVMTRITYCSTNARGEKELHQAVKRALEEIFAVSSKKAGIATDDLGEIVIVGNTCMHHLFLGLSPSSLGRSPFTPVLNTPYDVKAGVLELKKLRPSVNVHTLPVLGGFVGADTVGVLLATEPWKSNDNQLIMDIGTNGEIVLSTQGRLLTCSVATGPAFEGAHIRFGMRAAAGAIESITIHPDLTVEWKSISSEKPKGMCGSGIISGVAGLFARGIVNRTGKLNGALSASRLRKGKEGFEFVIAWAPETAINQDIVITQKDIENIQMAKAALYAGAKILMKRAAVKKVDRVLLTGAFGSYIDPRAAYQIGMFPDCNLESVSMVGNAAGEGAVIALLNRDARARAAELQSLVEYVELTLDPFFEHEFAMAMMLPHLKDTFSIL